MSSRPTRSSPRSPHAGWLLLALCLAACASPVGVERATPREVQRELTESALSGDRPSAESRELLTRLGFREAFDDDPDGTLARLHAELATEGDADRLFALAELSFLQAEEDRSRPRALAAAIYAYAFLFESDRDLWADPFDPRIQIARNVYNRGLTYGLGAGDGERVEVESRTIDLPFGTLDLQLAEGATDWAGWRLVEFAPAADFHVRGLANRYRHAGLGAPLAASLAEPESGGLPPAAERVPKQLRVPVTAFLRLDDVRAALGAGEVVGQLEIYAEDARSRLEVSGQVVPLEIEKSSSLALTLEGSNIWSFSLAGFRLGDYLPGGEKDRLIFLHPYRPGRIPLVLVHGTFSSPATWAEMVNELENDPLISQRYQIWLFVYNTGNPIAYSGGILVETLREVVAELDPEGREPALQRMVVIGHSQGGLLTKLTAVESGDLFWRNVSDEPIDALDLKPESRELLERSLFFHPLPFVQRVVFMSTPHGGSYLANWAPANWVSRLVKMPLRITELGVDVATQGQEGLVLNRVMRQPPTSLDNMRPSNPFLETLHSLPVDPRIEAHSIIAVRGDGDPEEGSDGVVRYPAAHIAGVVSEKVVQPSGHSVQVQPAAIQEVRRILVEHLSDQ